MKPPSTLAVGPFTYTVTTKRRHLKDAMILEKSALFGHCHPRHLRITLDKNVAHDIIAETLLHEILHALTDMTGLASELGDTDEKVVRALSPALLDVLRRNPDLVAYLTD